MADSDHAQAHTEDRSVESQLAEDVQPEMLNAQPPAAQLEDPEPGVGAEAEPGWAGAEVMSAGAEVM